jgi:hypothetical protein
VLHVPEKRQLGRVLPRDTGATISAIGSSASVHHGFGDELADFEQQGTQI